MPKFKSEGEVYKQCIAEGNLIPNAAINLQRVKDALLISEEDIESAEDSINKKRWNSGYKAYYDVLRELIEAYLSFEQVKSRNHQCLFSYLCVKHPELELSWDFFEKIRTKRNGINYYASKVSEKDWKEVKLQFNLYIKLFMKEIKNKIKEFKLISLFLFLYFELFINLLHVFLDPAQH